MGLILLFAAAIESLAGQPVDMNESAGGTDPSTPRFLIVDLEIRGIRGSARSIVAAETRLNVGSTYTESQLRRACNRINRLPFVIHAEFSLKRGPTRSTYVLLIEVQRGKDVYAECSARGGHEHLFSPNQTVLGLGARRFFGRRHLAYATVTTDMEDEGPWTGGEQLHLGTSHYQLLHRNLFLNFDLQVNLSQERRVEDMSTGTEPRLETDADSSPSVVLAIPLRGDHWIHVQASHFELSQSYSGKQERETFEDRIDESHERYRLGYRLDRLDDAVIPRQGTRLDLTAVLHRSRSRFDYTEFDNQGPERRILQQDRRTVRVSSQLLTLDMAYYHPVMPGISLYGLADIKGVLNSRETVTLDLRESVGDNDADIPLELEADWEATLEIGFNADLNGFSLFRDTQLQGHARYARNPWFREHSEVKALELSLVFRNPSLLIRLGAQWADGNPDQLQPAPCTDGIP